MNPNPRFRQSYDAAWQIAEPSCPRRAEGGMSPPTTPHTAPAVFRSHVKTDSVPFDFGSVSRWRKYVMISNYFQASVPRQPFLRIFSLHLRLFQGRILFPFSFSRIFPLKNCQSKPNCWHLSSERFNPLPQHSNCSIRTHSDVITL